MAGLLPVATSFAERRLHLGYRQVACKPFAIGEARSFAAMSSLRHDPARGRAAVRRRQLGGIRRSMGLRRELPAPSATSSTRPDVPQVASRRFAVGLHLAEPGRFRHGSQIRIEESPPPWNPPTKPSR
jgi:hypothetical protein